MDSFRSVAVATTIFFGYCLVSAHLCPASITSVGDVSLGFGIEIAQQADGSLTVAAPTSMMDVGDINIASQPGLIGSFTIDGTSVSTQGSQVVVGESGSGTLEIRNGGAVTSDQFQSPYLLIGRESSASGTVHFHGNGSKLVFPDGIASVGVEGLGTMLIEDSARATFRSVAIGGSESHNNETSAYGSTTVRGPGSLLEASGQLSVGSWAIGVLRVEEGAQVRSGTQQFNNVATIGHAQFGGFNDGQLGSGSVFVDGAGSLLSQNGTLVIGGTGSGSLSVTNGGVATSGIAVIAGDSTFNQFANGSGTVTLDDPGSQWNVTNMVLGQYGTGQITLSDGARLINSNTEFFSGGSSSGQNTVIGAEQGSFGRLIVDGVATQWVDNSETLTIGSRGTGELVIQGGAVVSSNQVQISPVPGGRGNVLVTGSGSRWLVDSLSIGEQGGNGSLIIADGASVEDVSFNSEANVSEGGLLILDQGTFHGSLSGRRNRELGNFGVVRGSGRLNAQVTNEASGLIRVDSGDRLSISETLDNFGGRIEVSAGELEVDGPYFNSNDGTLVADDSTLKFSAPVFSNTVDHLNEGTLLITGGHNSVFGEIENQGSMTLAGNSATTFFDNVQNDGSIHVLTGSVATFVGSLSGNGATGGGTVLAEGGISPGFSPGVMEFGGDIMFGEISQLNIEIGPNDHDSLEIAGSASIDGELVLDALAALENDTVLEILTADSIVGSFDSVPELGEDLGFGVVFGGISYHADSVEISLLQQSSDFNGDGNVDGADLGSWQANYGSAGGAALSDGDAQRDDDVDGSDFLAWQSAWQAPEPPAASQTVPEPSSIAILLLSVAAVAARRP